jgi:hypothetical protein
MWHNLTSEDKAIVHQFTASDPELNCIVAPHINAESLSFDCFHLMFTDEVFNIVLVDTDHYCQQHIQKQEYKTWQPDITIDDTYCFITLVILIGHGDWYTIKECLMSCIILHSTQKL